MAVGIPKSVVVVVDCSDSDDPADRRHAEPAWRQYAVVPMIVEVELVVQDLNTYCPTASYLEAASTDALGGQAVPCSACYAFLEDFVGAYRKAVQDLRETD